MINYDLAIIGAGWAGFNAAIKAAQSGLSVALIENDAVGGTCLNRGCIPTKSLVQSAKIYSLAKKSSRFGIDITNAQINFPLVQKRKAEVVQGLRAGMEFLLKNKNVKYISAKAKLVSSDEVCAGTERLKAKFILIATGSRPAQLPALKFDGKKVISSDEALNLEAIPKDLLIIGGGVIGCEFASIFNAFGTKVSIVELAPQLLPLEDKEVAKKIENAFKKKGIKVMTKTDASTVDLAGYDLALLSIGRTPNSQGLGLEEAGIKLEKGRVIVDECLKTNLGNVYAAGDCVGGKLLAHVASYQGRLAVENMLGKSIAADLRVVPNCIFTDPEVASVGINEFEAALRGIEVDVKRFDFMASGMARILDEAEGFIKVISDKQSGEILGAGIVGPKATELIASLTLAVKLRLKATDIAGAIFAHPTLSESIAEIF